MRFLLVLATQLALFAAADVAEVIGGLHKNDLKEQRAQSSHMMLSEMDLGEAPNPDLVFADEERSEFRLGDLDTDKFEAKGDKYESNLLDAKKKGLSAEKAANFFQSEVEEKEKMPKMTANSDAEEKHQHVTSWAKNKRWLMSDGSDADDEDDDENDDDDGEDETWKIGENKATLKDLEELLSKLEFGDRKEKKAKSDEKEPFDITEEIKEPQLKDAVTAFSDLEKSLIGEGVNKLAELVLGQKNDKKMDPKALEKVLADPNTSAEDKMAKVLEGEMSTKTMTSIDGTVKRVLDTIEDLAAPKPEGKQEIKASEEKWNKRLHEMSDIEKMATGIGIELRDTIEKIEEKIEGPEAASKKSPLAPLAPISKMGRLALQGEVKKLGELVLGKSLKQLKSLKDSKVFKADASPAAIKDSVKILQHLVEVEEADPDVQNEINLAIEKHVQKLVNFLHEPAHEKKESASKDTIDSVGNSVLDTIQGLTEPKPETKEEMKASEDRWNERLGEMSDVQKMATAGAVEVKDTIDKIENALNQKDDKRLGQKDWQQIKDAVKHWTDSLSKNDDEQHQKDMEKILSDPEMSDAEKLAKVQQKDWKTINSLQKSIAVSTTIDNIENALNHRDDKRLGQKDWQQIKDAVKHWTDSLSTNDDEQQHEKHMEQILSHPEMSDAEKLAKVQQKDWKTMNDAVKKWADSPRKMDDEKMDQKAWETVVADPQISDDEKLTRFLKSMLKSDEEKSTKNRDKLDEVDPPIPRTVDTIELKDSIEKINAAIAVPQKLGMENPVLKDEVKKLAAMVLGKPLNLKDSKVFKADASSAIIKDSVKTLNNLVEVKDNPENAHTNMQNMINLAIKEHTEKLVNSLQEPIAVSTTGESGSLPMDTRADDVKDTIDKIENALNHKDDKRLGQKDWQQIKDAVKHWTDSLSKNDDDKKQHEKDMEEILSHPEMSDAEKLAKVQQKDWKTIKDAVKKWADSLPKTDDDKTDQKDWEKVLSDPAVSDEDKLTKVLESKLKDLKGVREKIDEVGGRTLDTIQDLIEPNKPETPQEIKAAEKRWNERLGKMTDIEKMATGIGIELKDTIEKINKAVTVPQKLLDKLSKDAQVQPLKPVLKDEVKKLAAMVLEKPLNVKEFEVFKADASSAVIKDSVKTLNNLIDHKDDSENAEPHMQKMINLAIKEHTEKLVNSLQEPIDFSPVDATEVKDTIEKIHEAIALPQKLSKDSPLKGLATKHVPVLKDEVKKLAAMVLEKNLDLKDSKVFKADASSAVIKDSVKTLNNLVGFKDNSENAEPLMQKMINLAIEEHAEKLVNSLQDAADVKDTIDEPQTENFGKLINMASDMAADSVEVKDTIEKIHDAIAVPHKMASKDKVLKDEVKKLAAMVLGKPLNLKDSKVFKADASHAVIKDSVKTLNNLVGFKDNPENAHTNMQNMINLAIKEHTQKLVNSLQEPIAVSTTGAVDVKDAIDEIEKIEKHTEELVNEIEKHTEEHTEALVNALQEPVAVSTAGADEVKDTIDEIENALTSAEKALNAEGHRGTEEVHPAAEKTHHPTEAIETHKGPLSDDAYGKPAEDESLVVEDEDESPLPVNDKAPTRATSKPAEPEVKPEEPQVEEKELEAEKEEQIESAPDHDQEKAAALEEKRRSEHHLKERSESVQEEEELEVKKPEEKFHVDEDEDAPLPEKPHEETPKPVKTKAERYRAMDKVVNEEEDYDPLPPTNYESSVDAQGNVHTHVRRE